MIAGALQSHLPPMPQDRTAAPPSMQDHPTAAPMAFAPLLERAPIAPIDVQIVATLTAVEDTSALGNPRTEATHSFAASSLFNTQAVGAPTGASLQTVVSTIGPQPDRVALSALAAPRSDSRAAPRLPPLAPQGVPAEAEPSARSMRDIASLPLRGSAGFAVSENTSRPRPSGDAHRPTSEPASALAAAVKRAAFALTSAGQVHVTVAAGAHGVIIASRLNRAHPDEVDRYAQATLELAEEFGCAIETLTINGRPLRSYLAGRA